MCTWDTCYYGHFKWNVYLGHWFKFCCDWSVIKDTWCSLSAGSHIPFVGFSWKFTFAVLWAVASNSFSFVVIGRTMWLQEQFSILAVLLFLNRDFTENSYLWCYTPSLLYLTFHQRNFPGNSHISLAKLAETRCEWDVSRSIVGHFTWSTKNILAYILACTLLKILTSHSQSFSLQTVQVWLWLVKNWRSGKS